MLVDSLHPALEDRVEALDGVRVYVTAHILAEAVLGEVVSGEVLAERTILTGFVGHDVGLGRDVRLDDRQQIGRLGAVHMEGAGGTAALNQGQNGVLMGGPAALLHALLAANVGLVDFYDGTLAAHGLHAEAGHGLANAVRKEPRRLEARPCGRIAESIT